MLLTRTPSLELSWLPQPKQISLPTIVVNHDEGYDGCYYTPRNGQILIAGRHYDAGNGIIEIRHDSHEATLIHEFRHHLQFHAGIPIEGNSFVGTHGNSYKEKIVNYFTTQPTELDALQFEMTHCKPPDYVKEWHEWITNHHPHHQQRQKQ